MTDTANQVKSARATVLVVPASELATLVVTGGDRLTWLNGLVTCDLAKRRPGDAVYGLAVAKSGRILADIVVVVDDTELVIVVPVAAAETVRTSLDHYLIMEDAEIAAGSDAFAVWLAHGPRSAELLAAARTAGAIGGVIDRTGLGGAILLARRDVEATVRAAIESSVAATGGAIGDASGWDALRIEQAVPAYGADFDGETLPQEAGLEKTAVSFAKGCYLGQEVICMLEMRGKVKRRIVPLLVEGGATPARGATVTDASGANVGEVTSVAFSPTLARTIVLAMVKRKLSEPGSELRVGDAVAKVVERPVS